MGTIITSAEPPQPLTTRVAGWPRGRALVVIAVLLAMLAAAGWSAGHGPAPRLNTTTAEASDLDLYRATADELEAEIRRVFDRLAMSGIHPVERSGPGAG